MIFAETEPTRRRRHSFTACRSEFARKRRKLLWYCFVFGLKGNSQYGDNDWLQLTLWGTNGSFHKYFINFMSTCKASTWLFLSHIKKKIRTKGLQASVNRSKLNLFGLLLIFSERNPVHYLVDLIILFCFLIAQMFLMLCLRY